MSGSNGSGSDRNKGENEYVEELAMDSETYETASNTAAAGGDELGYVNNVLERLDEEMDVRGGLELQEPNAQVDDVMLQNNEYIPSPPYAPQSPQQYSPQSVVDSVSSSNVPVELNRASDLLMALSVRVDANKSKIIELANSSMDELSRKAQEGEPLWQRLGRDDPETLNEAEYIKEFRALDASLQEIMKMVETRNLCDLDGINSEFTSGIIRNQNPNFQRESEPDSLLTEASREVGFVGVSPTILVEWLMDCNQWSSMFSSIVSSATLIGVLSTGSQPRISSDTVQVMRAEFHMPTPLVPVRKCQFARYCKQISPKTWGVVDVSLENIFPYPMIRFRKRPSGCLIEELPDGSSKVMWVEHVEVDNQSVHPLFRSLVHSGYAFSANRWVATLIRHCEWVATLMSDSVPTIGGELMLRNGKESLLRLAERMMRNFCVDSSASSNNSWMPFPVNGAEDCMVMNKSISVIPGNPVTTVVFTTSIWIPTPPKIVFDFLRRDESRKKWDILACRHEAREISNIVKGENPDNRVSIMQVIDTSAMKVVITHLQESYSEPTGSYVVYAPIDIPAMAALLSGGNPDIVNILPSGFVIHPDRAVAKGNEGNIGSVVTIMFHIIDDLSGDSNFPSDSVSSMYRILTDTAFNITSVVPGRCPEYR